MPITIDDLERRRAAADSAPGNYLWPSSASQWARESMELHRAQTAEIERLKVEIEKLREEIADLHREGA